jgi:hypothetical protein
MIAEIISNPVAWPLWAVLVFAATMYPLGFMLPGCVCCGSTGCTTCGNASTPYEEQDSGQGRMCCSGTLASSVTVRITHQGAATGSYAELLGPLYDGRRIRTTRTVDCSSIDGDYVLTRYRPNGDYYNTNGCAWGYTGPSTINSNGTTPGIAFITLGPTPEYQYLPFPQWLLYFGAAYFLGYTLLEETCAAPCTTISYSPTTGAGPNPVVGVYDVYSGPGVSYNDPFTAEAGPYYEQKCTPPAGVIFGTISLRVYVGRARRTDVVHTCQYTVELL